MNAMLKDKNQIYTKMRKYRGKNTSQKTAKLITPVGVYHGEDVLEGFAADAEYLGRDRGEPDVYDNKFYRLCKADNLYIFELKEQSSVKIPPMTIIDLEEILNKKMKRGKACDIYQLTVEHLQYCGQDAKASILKLLNSILDKIYYMSCTQLKTGMGTALHKGKRKPLDRSEAYRRVTVTPIIGSILDRYLDPLCERILRPIQSSEQFGFTRNISYLQASVLRGECQRWALDHKMTCYGVSLDGEAAFPSVDRDILVRELYSVGERGDILHHSRGTYQNYMGS